MQHEIGSIYKSQAQRKLSKRYEKRALYIVQEVPLKLVIFN